MNKMTPFALLIVIVLAGCSAPRKRTQTCPPEEKQQCTNKKAKRVSGPLSDTDVAWDEQDRK